MTENLISVNTGVTIDQIESLYSKLHQNHEIVLQLPGGLADGGLWGVQASLNQFIVTWARTALNATLRTHIRAGQPDDQVAQLSKLCRQTYGLTALSMARRILATDAKTEISQYEALLPAVSRLTSMDSSDFNSCISGNSIDLICIANSKTKRFIKPLYGRPEQGRVINESEMESLISKLISSLTRGRREIAIKFSRYIGDLGLVLYELFCNTDEHALTDFDVNLFSTGTRGIRFAMVGMDGGTIASKERPDIQPSIEMTVYDSGIGFANRLARVNLFQNGHEQNWQFVKDCFMPGKTSKMQRNAGDGLARVKKIVKGLHGKISLRTGVVRSEWDFTTDEQVNCAEGGAAFGSTVHIIIPIVGNS